MNKEPHIDDYIDSDTYNKVWDNWKKSVMLAEPDHCNEHDRLTGDEPEIDQHVSGAKLDHDKMDLSLLQLLPNAMLEICRVMDYGQTKYTRGGFLDVPEGPRRYSSAMMRHWFKELLEKFDDGDPFYDTEKGLPFKGKIRHDAQVAVNALFRLECTMREEIANAETITIPDGFYSQDKK